MGSGARTGVPLCAGLIGGVVLSLLLFPTDYVDNPCQQSLPPAEPIDSSEHWKVVVQKPPPGPVNPEAPKVVRARFAATELGIRERLAVFILAESSLGAALNASLGPHVPRVHVFADASRVDTELAQLPNLSPYRANGQHAHMHILNAIFNLTMHESFDWFMLVRDSTYVNPFALVRLIDSISWSKPIALGASDQSGRCKIDAGIVLSNPAMQILVQQRHLCNAIVASSDELALEQCVAMATNLSCEEGNEEGRFFWWNGVTQDGSASPHEALSRWSERPRFNSSLTVSRLLSDADAHALHEHFVHVEMAKVAEEVRMLEREVAELSEEQLKIPTWPSAIPNPSRPPNRYQVTSWDFFTQSDIFRNEPNQNVRPLIGNDKADIDEVLASARAWQETREPFLDFVLMRNGYRVFDPMRGMDYTLDLVYRTSDGRTEVRRIHLNRPIAHTQLLHHVPYVKEDADLTIVVPVAGETEVLPARRLLARHARICGAPADEARKTRIVIAVRHVDPSSADAIASDLIELARRCKRYGIETSLLRLPTEEELDSESENGRSKASLPIAAVALDEAVDHYGPQTLFLLLPPYADIQRDFLDRVRINTIKHFQIFFPVPFMEFHPTINGMDMDDREAKQSRDEKRRLAMRRLRDGSPPRRRRPLVVHKDQGRFDSSDFSVLSVYGSDYSNLRARLAAHSLDLSSIFLGQDGLHILRAIEPTLRLRYHQRTCDSQLNDVDYVRCMMSRRENVASKDQLANLLFADN